MNAKEILERILFEQKITYAELARRMGLTRAQMLYDIRDGRVKKISESYAKKIMEAFPGQYSRVWLLTGEGEMLNTAESNGKPSPQPTEKDYKLIPLIHIDSVGGMHSKNDVVDEIEYIEKYVPFMEAHDGDKAIFQSGDSMIPTIPPGSILQIREVENWREYFGYGGIFVLLLKDGRRITKEVNRYDPDPKNYVMCISHNPSVADEELPKAMIVAVWKVIKILTDRGW